MNISRTGAHKNYGKKKIVSGLKLRIPSRTKFHNNVHLSFQNEVVINSRPVKHTDGISEHVYEISLTLEDISALIDFLGACVSKHDAKLLHDHLDKQVPALVKLLACATGNQPVPIREESKVNRMPLPPVN